jgi:hypothetical protein
MQDSMYKSVYYRINKAKTAYKWLNHVITRKIYFVQYFGGMEMIRFSITDLKTGKEPDMGKIALEEDWAKELMYCDMEGFYIGEDCTLILADECGNFAYCPGNRFQINLLEI